MKLFQANHCHEDQTLCSSSWIKDMSKLVTSASHIPKAFCDALPLIRTHTLDCLMPIDKSIFLHYSQDTNCVIIHCCVWKRMIMFPRQGGPGSSSRHIIPPRLPSLECQGVTHPSYLSLRACFLSAGLKALPLTYEEQQH